jgi:hypothetical protein
MVGGLRLTQVKSRVNLDKVKIKADQSIQEILTAKKAAYA